MRNCEICNKEFEPSLIGKPPGHPSPNQKCCSKSCRDKKFYKNNTDKCKVNSKVQRKKQVESGKPRGQGTKTKELYLWMVELKSKPCCDCGKCFPICCMHFDHVKGEKLHNVGSMFAHTYSKSLIEEEIAKCELVCSNCHSIRTRNRKRDETGAYTKGTKEQQYLYEYEAKLFRCSPILSSQCWPAQQIQVN